MLIRLVTMWMRADLFALSFFAFCMMGILLKLCLFDLTLYVPSTIFQLNRDRSSWVEPVLSWDKCVLLKDHNAVTRVRLETAALRSRVKYSTTEPLRSQFYWSALINYIHCMDHSCIEWCSHV